MESLWNVWNILIGFKSPKSFDLSIMSYSFESNCYKILTLVIISYVNHYNFREKQGKQGSSSQIFLPKGTFQREMYLYVETSIYDIYVNALWNAVLRCSFISRCIFLMSPCKPSIKGPISAIRENFTFIFLAVFSYYQKKFEFRGKTGH